MRLYARKTVSYAAAILVFSSCICLAGNIPDNPHSEAGDCSMCHVASAEKLRGWFTFGSTKRELKTDLNQVCLTCHTVEPTHAGGFFGVGIGHGVGKKPSLNLQNLPLAGDGTITCATTCHKMHVTSDDGQLQRKLLRAPVNLLCISCHNM